MSKYTKASRRRKTWAVICTTALLAVGLATAGGTAAYADTAPTVTQEVHWLLPAGSVSTGITAVYPLTNSVDGYEAATPQSLLVNPAQCVTGTPGVIQNDTYSGTQAQIDAILADNKLTKTNGVYEDSAVVTGWSFSLQPLCATAAVTVVPSTCTAPGSVTDTLLNATGVLDQSVGTHSTEFTAASGAVFPNGTATETLSYTVPAIITGPTCGNVTIPPKHPAPCTTRACMTPTPPAHTIVNSTPTVTTLGMKANENKTPVATATIPATGTALAYTGSRGTVVELGLAGLLLILGVTFIILRRRERAKEE